LKHPQSNTWFQPSQALKRQIDPVILSWLTDSGSLTQRLKNYCPEHFSLKVLGEEWVKADNSEAMLLGIEPSQKVLLRQVHLKCEDQVCVYARSIIPLLTLQGKHRRLKFLGKKPLGEYLFSSPGLERSIIEWSQLATGSSLHRIALGESAASNKPVWGRRSLFKIDKKPLLVSEFFLPVLFL
jgi:chorismate--pyruvate lyase